MQVRGGWAAGYRRTHSSTGYDSKEYFIAKICFDAVENEPCEICPLSADPDPPGAVFNARSTRKKADSFFSEDHKEVLGRFVFGSIAIIINEPSRR